MIHSLPCPALRVDGVKVEDFSFTPAFNVVALQPVKGRYANICTIVFPEEFFQILFFFAIFLILHWYFVYR